VKNNSSNKTTISKQANRQTQLKAMVAVQTKSNRRNQRTPIWILFGIILTFVAIITLPDWNEPRQEKLSGDASAVEPFDADRASCPYQRWDDLTSDEKNPQMGSRHMITPPADDKVTLVCCQTTAGPWNIAVHHAWAPNGARRFLQMVQDQYFNKNQVPLMRCVHGFLCQFGLAGLASKAFKQTIPDDPNWLPEGPDHRQHGDVKRFAQGYLAYAGAGKHSRNNQFIVALQPNGRLGGGSPWEVPWGEVVGRHSFETLSKIFTGYGEHGPKQGMLWKEEYLAYVQGDFPRLDSIQSCHVVDRKVFG
jgi:cyclophilin family peptidyl-prolyl cis-trans isomerase